MKDMKLCFNDILLLPKYSELDSRTLPNISTNICGIELKVPIISSPMDSVTGKFMLVVMDKLGGLGILTRHISLSNNDELAVQIEEMKWAKEQGAKNIGCAIGIKRDVGFKAKSILNADCGCKVICLDVAHGHHKKMYEAIGVLSKLKDEYNFSIMAGNVCTPEATKRFAESGVDIIKVGIGPGASCTTRIVTGFGKTQLSAIQESYDEIKDINVAIIADGGLRTSGDMVKALWAGADACMIGYMLAGTNATPRIDGKRVYRGMSSRAVSERPDIAPEGVVIAVGDNGKTEEVVGEYVKGIRSGLAMGGANNISELRECDYDIVSTLSLSETLPRNS